MVDVLHLITIIAHRFYEFTSLDDVISLDYACINKVARNQLHTSLARINITGLNYEAPSADWLVKRKLSPACVHVHSQMTDADLQELMKLPIRVQKISLSSHEVSNTVMENFLDMNPDLPELVITYPAASVQMLTDVLERCRNVQTVNIKGCVRLMDNGALVKISELCPNVKSLHFSDLHLARQEIHFQQLATTCTQLREIHWQGSRVEYTPGFAVFAHHSPHSLEVLDFQDIEFPGETLSVLINRSPHLKEFRLRSCGMHRDSVVPFAAALALCMDLEVLHLYSCAWFDETCLQDLLSASKLRSFVYNACFAMSLDSLCGAMRTFSNLQHLDLSMILAMSHCAQVLNTLAIYCTRLKSLKLTCAGWNQQHYLDLLLRRCTQLTTLVLTYLSAPIAFDCSHLHNLQNLKLVSAQELDDKIVLSILANCPKLRTLSLVASHKLWSNLEIVRSIAKHCPLLRLFHIERCTSTFRREFEKLQAARGRYRLKFEYTEVIEARCTIQ